MRKMLYLLLMAVNICSLQAQNNIDKYLFVEIPQRDVNKEKLLPLLRHGIEIMASEECLEDRKKIPDFKNENYAVSYVTFHPMIGLGSIFPTMDGMYELLHKIRKAAGFKPGPDIGFAPMLLSKVVVNSVKLMQETIMLMVDKARRDDKTYTSTLYISEPTELSEYPPGMDDKKELMPILGRAIEIMASKEHEEDRKMILEVGDEEDALNHVMFASKFRSRDEVYELSEKIQELEKFNSGRGAAVLLLSNVVLNSVRLQDSTIMLIVYEVRAGDRSFGRPKHVKEIPQ